MYHSIQRYAHSLTLLLVLSLAGLSASPAFGQLDIKPGVRGGGNFATLGGDDAELVFALGGQEQEIPIDRRTGFMVGGYALIDFAGPFALHPELLYVQKGAQVETEFSFQGQTETVTSTLQLSYLELPVLAKFQVPLGGPVSPNVFAGPSVGFNVGSSQETETGGQSESADVEVSGTEFGLTLGAGIGFKLGVGTANVDVRYNLGLSNLPSEGDASVKNRGIGVTAGLTF